MLSWSLGGRKGCARRGGGDRPKLLLVAIFGICFLPSIPLPENWSSPQLSHLDDCKGFPKSTSVISSFPGQPVPKSLILWPSVETL